MSFHGVVDCQALACQGIYVAPCLGPRAKEKIAEPIAAPIAEQIVEKIVEKIDLKKIDLS